MRHTCNILVKKTSQAEHPSFWDQIVWGLEFIFSYQDLQDSSLWFNTSEKHPWIFGLSFFLTFLISSPALEFIPRDKSLPCRGECPTLVTINASIQPYINPNKSNAWIHESKQTINSGTSSTTSINRKNKYHTLQENPVLTTENSVGTLRKSVTKTACQQNAHRNGLLE